MMEHQLPETAYSHTQSLGNWTKRLDKTSLKILIVEDELKTLMGITSLIGEISESYEIVGEARSGEAGIKLALETNPDMIITDIQMKGMTGLEMIKELNALKCPSKYIILSGYAEFQYAREAIALGSMDYLLKPISKELLEESLKKVKTSIEEEALEIHPSSMPTNVILERVLFAPDYEGGKWDQELEKRFANDQDAYFLLIRGENRIVPSDFEAIINELKRALPMTSFYACREQGNKENYIVISQATKEIQKQLHGATRLCLEKVNPYIVFSGAVISNMRKLQEIRKRLLDISNWNLSLCTQGIIEEDRIAEIKPQKFSYPSELERKVIASIGENNIEETEQLVHHFIQYFSDNMYSYGEIREALICLTAAILYAIRRASYGLYENISNLNILEWVKDILFLENYPRIISNVLRQYQLYSKNLKSGKHPIIHKVLQILEKEYKQELPLEEMAERMNVTPEYLSTLFMKELGIKYTTYRSQIRIDVAKRLLQEGKLKIYEIAEESGYPDVKYFTKVFKKYTGVNPREYIRTIVKN